MAVRDINSTRVEPNHGAWYALTRKYQLGTLWVVQTVGHHLLKEQSLLALRSLVETAAARARRIVSCRNG